MVTLILTPSTNISAAGVIDNALSTALKVAEHATLDTYHIKSGDVATTPFRDVFENPEAYYIKHDNEFFVVVSFTMNTE